MAYYIAVQKEDGSYLGLNIKKSGYFGNSYTYQERGACTLEEIDRYTTRYSNEAFFKSCLLSEKIFPIDDIEHPLVIYYYKKDENGKEERKISDYILYKESKSFVENPALVIEYIFNKAKENDYLFFRQLADTLPANLTTASLVTKIASLLEKNATNERDELGLNNCSPLGDNMVTATAKLLIYKNHIIKENGTVTYTKEINHESFHSLLAFISNYEKMQSKDKNSGYTKTLKLEEN